MADANEPPLPLISYGPPQPLPPWKDPRRIEQFAWLWKSEAKEKKSEATDDAKTSFLATLDDDDAATDDLLDE